MQTSTIRQVQRRTILRTAASIALGAPMLVLAQTRKLRVGHLFAADHPVHKGLVVNAAAMQRRTAGRMSIEIFPNAQLGNARELLS